MAVEQDVHSFRIDEQGNRYEALEMIYTEYDVGRIRAGYCCIECGQAHEEAFPEKCSTCAYPMKEEQGKRFGEEFAGYTTIGPSRSRAELLAEDEEAKARARYKQAKPTSSIWVPGS